MRSYLNPAVRRDGAFGGLFADDEAPGPEDSVRGYLDMLGLDAAAMEVTADDARRVVGAMVADYTGLV